MAESAPRRIASLLASGTEIVYALGLGERLVAVSHECDFPPAANTKPRVTRSNVAAPTSGEIDTQVRDMLAAGAALYEIDAQQLVELRPDLIITQAQCDVCAVKYEDVLSLVREQPALSATQVVALNPLTLAEIFSDIEEVGAAAGATAAAAHYVATLRERVNRIETQTLALASESRPRVAAIEWIEPLMLSGNWMPELIRIAGGVQPLAQAGRHSTYNSWSEICAYDPEVVIVMPCGFDLARGVAEAEVLRRLPGWDQMAAVRSDRVYAVDGNAYFNRSGPRIVDSLEILAGLLHPELFGWPAERTGDVAVWQRL